MMRKLFYWLCAALLVVSSCHRYHANVTGKAIWKPSEDVLKQIFKCRDNPKTYLPCLIQVMKKNKANDEAIQFTQRIEGLGFASEFQQLLGQVALVKTLELGADYSQGCYLVNGNPNIINVLLPKMLPSNFWLQDCRVIKTDANADNGSQTFYFNYELKDCHACQVKEVKSVAFRFDKEGDFEGFNIR